MRFTLENKHTLKENEVKEVERKMKEIIKGVIPTVRIEDVMMGKEEKRAEGWRFIGGGHVGWGGI